MKVPRPNSTSSRRVLEHVASEPRTPGNTTGRVLVALKPGPDGAHRITLVDPDDTPVAIRQNSIRTNAQNNEEVFLIAVARRFGAWQIARDEHGIDGAARVRHHDRAVLLEVAL